MKEFKNIDLTKYKLVSPSNISKKEGRRVMYDIKTKNKSFIIHKNTLNILSHNCDGHHIASLLINFFYKWFPYIIENGNLFKIVTPLVVCDYKDRRKYFYTKEEYVKYAKNKKLTGFNYLKGLGSLSIDDWIWVMDNKALFKIVKDRSANKYLSIVFGDSSQKRRNWLEGVK